MSELTKINIPDLGDVEEVEVIELCAEVGQTIDSEDPIMVLETDKAAMEIPASVSGVIKNIYISVGDMVSQGMPFIEVEVSISKDEVNSKDEVKEKANEVSDSKKPIKKEVLKEIVVATNSPINYKNSSIHSGPAVRKLAREFGINLAEVKGCGPKGRILKEDLHVFVSNRLSNKSQSGFQPSQPDIDYSKWGEVKLEKLSKFQKTAAKNLHTSWINIPHVTQHDDADITNLLLLRDRKSVV